jgi:diadenylate cyclase
MPWMHWQSVVDFLVLAAVFYVVLRWARQTRALRVIVWIAGVQAASRVAGWLDLVITGWVLSGVSVLLVLLLLFGFQSELRSALLRLDSLVRLGLKPIMKAFVPSNRAIAAAAFRMASERLGALIAIARNDSVRELVSGGVPLGAEITPELLMALFRKDSPLHDGAVIVEAERIVRAGAVLPLTHREEVPATFGTRHRAAMGLAERSDALVVAVSEERGAVTLMHGRNIVDLTSSEELADRLDELRTQPPAGRPGALRRLLFQDLRYKFAALGMAAAVIALSVLSTGATVRTISVPVEFVNVPPGMAISSQSPNRIEAQVRGSRWLIDSVTDSGLVARVDLRRAGQGMQDVRVRPDALNVPPGVVVERVNPPGITVRLVQKLP